MSDLNLYPTEETAIKEVFVTLQRKYPGMVDSKENLIAFATEAENRFKEIGFRIQVDVTTLDLMGDKVVLSPTIEIVDRIQREEFHDHERHQAEVQHGLADGVVGSITEDGRMVEPKSSLVAPETKPSSLILPPGSAFKKD